MVNLFRYMQLPEWQGTKNSEFRGRGVGYLFFAVILAVKSVGWKCPDTVGQRIWIS